MKKYLSLLVSGSIFLAGSITSHAVIYSIDLSPAGGSALNLGPVPTHYFGDHAVGLAAPNETGMPPSPATGNELGLGITFDSVSKMLSFHVGYGSAFGFTDLMGPYAAAHFHGPGPVMFPGPNLSAGIIHGMGAFHTPAGPFSGSFVGAVPLSPAEEMMLFDNNIYLNIHSGFAGAGEIRGQLVVGPEPSSAALLLLLGAAAIPLRRRLR